jgi:hypothetical protein
MRPSFAPSLKELDEFWMEINNDQRFDNELKRFFTFLYACTFSRNIKSNFKMAIR